MLLRSIGLLLMIQIASVAQLPSVIWENKNLVGSPDPPLPYTTEPVFTDISWQRPIYAKAEPKGSRLFVVLQGGEAEKPSRIVQVDEAQPGETSPLLQMPERLVYGLAFDPDYASNGYIYVFSNGPTGQPERKNRISRFQMSPDRGVCDPASELAIIEWRSMGHDGGELGFGSDGMLYISSGDGTSDSDRWLSAQDLSNLLGGVLRIDVRHASSDTPYQIPEDNPFLGHEGARGEWWAFGLRNPWRLWCDLPSGQIWVGNNGQDLWESVHLIRRGENYGWSVYEGGHPFYPQRQQGPAPIVPPTVEHHHTEARSLTGGVVYHGRQLPQLEGAYIYGDYSTGKIWGVRHDGQQVTWQQELADTMHQIAGFALSRRGDLLIIDHGGGIHRLLPNIERPNSAKFPQRLSETNLFRSVPKHVVQDGVIPFRVNAPAWHDGAVAARYLALPQGETVGFQPRRGWHFPNGTVLLQTLSLPEENRHRRIETRLLVRDSNEWSGYTYQWNESQTDAQLVGKSGVRVNRPGASDQPPWQIPSRSECMSCHSRAVNFTLGMSTPQMNRSHRYGDVTMNQIQAFETLGIFKEAPKAEETQATPLVNPYDTSQNLSQRARAYLHVNCSSCHVEAGGGNARMELEFHRDLHDTGIVGARPQHATFEIGNAMLVAPGDPRRSVLSTRISRRGAGQMPPLFTRVVDPVGVQLIHDWIAELPKHERPFVRRWTEADLVSRLDQLATNRSPQKGKQVYRDLGCIQCHRIGDQGGGAGPDLSTIALRASPEEIIEALVDPSKKIAKEYALTSVTTADGIVFRGQLETEDSSTIRLRPPNSFDSPITINKSAIEDRRRINVSMMPAEMLNSCSEDQVLDLLAYLLQNDPGKAKDVPPQK